LSVGFCALSSAAARSVRRRSGRIGQRAGATGNSGCILHREVLAQLRYFSVATVASDDLNGYKME